MKALYVLAASAALAICFGCAPKEETGASGGMQNTPKSEAPQDESANKTPEGQLASMPVFRNKDGEIVCPMMKAVIKDPSTAPGHVDYEGVRYYICCDGCKELLTDGAKAKKLAEENFPDGKASL